MPAINFNNIINHLKYLSFLNRYTGYPGCEEASKYIFDYFEKKLGLKTWVEEYELPVPFDYGSSVSVHLDGGAIKIIEAYALLPNNVQASFGNYTGHLVYCGTGTIEELNTVGGEINGSIALMEFNSGYNWLSLMRLGAKAVIFIAPNDTIRSESDRKNLDVPLKFPRVYVSRNDGIYLRNLVFSRNRVIATVNVNMKWVHAKAKNIVAVLNGTDPNEMENTIALMAHYDSVSVVPALSPGAEEAIGVASLLELARLLKESPPRRPVWFIAFSGNGQGMAGGRDFIWHSKEVIKGGDGTSISFVWHYDHIGTTENKVLAPYAIKMAISLDFASDSDAVAVAGYGAFYGLGGPWYDWYSYDKDLTRFLFTGGRYGHYSPTENSYRLNQDVLPANSSRTTYRAFGLWASQLSMRQYLPSTLTYEAEVFARTGIWGICFTTALSIRLSYNTPFNLFEKINFENVIPQIEFSFALINAILNDTEWFDFNKVTISGGQKAGAFFTHKHKDDAGIGYVIVHGRIGLWNITKNWYEYNWTSIAGEDCDILLSVRIMNRPDLHGHEWLQFANIDDGTFVSKGMLPSLGWAASLAEYEILPYLINRTTGEVEYAPDMGVYGTYLWPHGYRFLTFEDPLIDGSGDKIVNLSMFKASTVALHDLFDPRTLLTPKMGSRIKILDVNDVELIQFSYVVSSPPSFESGENIVLGDPTSGYEVLLFVSPNSTIKVLFMTEQNTLGLLANNGEGIKVSEKYVSIVPTPLYFANDLMSLVETRMSGLGEAQLMGGGRGAYIRELYDQSRRELESAYKLKTENKHGDYYLALLKSWYYIQLAYSETKNILMDSSVTAVFFFVLIIPFILLIERLVFSAKGNKRVSTIIIIFALLMTMLFLIHPGFRVTPFSMVSALGFICLSLVALILIFMSNEIAGILRELRKKLVGVSFIQADTLGSVMISFSLAVENMRKRKFRTILVLSSLAIITFAAASFISVSPIQIIMGIPVEPSGFFQARYQGILVTGTDFFMPINPMVSSVVSNLAGKDTIIAPRAIIPVSTGGSYLYNKLGKQILIAGVFGFTPEERNILHLQDTILQEYNGTSAVKPWFSGGDTYVCYITEDIARELEVVPGDTVVFYGIGLKVLGVISQQRFSNVTDIDGIPVAPFDPLVTRPPRPRVYWGIIFIPYKLATDLGGITYSVAISCSESTSIQQIAEKITKYLGLTSHYVFVVKDTSANRSFRYTSERIFDVSNWQFSLVPIVICALVLLSTMTGAVYERIKEIYIYSVIGLNPMNVVGMFLGESIAYALISAPLGYIFSSILGNFSSVFANFASSSVVVVILSSILIILSSSIYPLRKVSKFVTPSLERVWRPPTRPKDNTWDIPLPIALETEEEARGMVAFITEYLKSYGSEAVSFMVEKLEHEKKIVEGENIYLSKAVMRLRPYETGLTEEMVFKTSRVKNRYVVMLTANLISGPRVLWIGSHLRVVDMVRKTMLVWKSLNKEDRDRFLKLGEDMFR
ncbi:MAG: M28 family peptidase [Candidatus Brockarchaeota archaeon]|nr:M28 family peptidase [Candidatus Brockarchaeota archaeon]